LPLIDYLYADAFALAAMPLAPPTMPLRFYATSITPRYIRRYDAMIIDAVYVASGAMRALR